MAVPAVPKLAIRDLHASFRSTAGHRVEVLAGINLDIAEGEFVSIVGSSGCGKTTLLRIVDGLISPTSGQIQLDGKPMTGPGTDRAFVFQIDALLPWRTLLDNIMIGLEIQGRAKAERRAQARSWIETVGLSGFESAYPSELSGGMRQRANIARALVVNPEVILMDEPFASLDAQTREIMQGELLRMWGLDAVKRKTVLFVTHQIDEAVYLSDRVIVLGANPGRVMADLNICLARPRELSVKHSIEFGEYADRIWKLIETDVRDAVARDMRERPAEPNGF
jgi:NitT/TauT family transport system ATP-binding protein